jgi:hypothetical protein
MYVFIPPTLETQVDGAHQGMLGVGMQLLDQGANYEWKRRKLRELVDQGAHHSLWLKDKSQADFLLIDEAQDVLLDEAMLLSALMDKVPNLRVLVVGGECTYAPIA